MIRISSPTSPAISTLHPPLRAPRMLHPGSTVIPPWDPTCHRAISCQFNANGTQLHLATKSNEASRRCVIVSTPHALLSPMRCEWSEVCRKIINTLYLNFLRYISSVISHITTHKMCFKDGAFASFFVSRWLIRLKVQSFEPFCMSLQRY